jgi:hypothetical protein
VVPVLLLGGCGASTGITSGRRLCQPLRTRRRRADAERADAGTARGRQPQGPVPEGHRRHPDEGKVYVNLLNGRNRTVMSLDMWQRDDKTWTAKQWYQCID